MDPETVRWRKALDLFGPSWLPESVAIAERDRNGEKTRRPSVGEEGGGAEVCSGFAGCWKWRHGQKTGAGREVEGGLPAAALAGMPKPRVCRDFPGCGKSGFG